MRAFFLIVMVLISAFASAQSTDAEYFKGFDEEISGKRFTYHSPFPDVTDALIIRGRADLDPIRWKTEVVPASYQGDFVTFIWVYSMDTDPEPVTFILRVNGMEWFRFSSPIKSEIGSWSVHGREGATLKFNVTLLDKFEDEMGFAILTLPTSAVKPGQVAMLEIAAEPVGDNSWFMTYKTGVAEQLDIYQNLVVVKDGDQLLHSLSVDMIHLGNDVPCTIQIEEQTTKTMLKAGYNHVEINLPKVDEPTNLKAVVRIDGRAAREKTFTIAPVKEWEVLLPAKA